MYPSPPFCKRVCNSSVELEFEVQAAPTSWIAVAMATARKVARSMICEKSQFGPSKSQNVNRGAKLGLPKNSTLEEG